MRETWKPIQGYEDCYAISNKGRVKRTGNFGSTSRGQLSGRIKRGYVVFHLCKGGIRKDHLAHRLVWATFNFAIKERLQINHLDGDKTNNRLDNLELCSRSENMKHAYRVLKIPAPNNPSFGSMNGSSKLRETDIPKIISMYRTGNYRQTDIGEKFGVSQRMISLIIRGEKWQHVNAATQKN